MSHYGSRLNLKSWGLVAVHFVRCSPIRKGALPSAKILRRVVINRERYYCTATIPVVNNDAVGKPVALSQELVPIDECRKLAALKSPTTIKLDSPKFKAIFTPELKKLANIFERYNYELRIVGGAVRDLLLDQLPHDVDFATTATPTQMKKMFKKERIRMVNEKGESHGTITALINYKETFEITTLQIHVVTNGRRTQVEFHKDWQLDAGCRDLTVNSLFLGLDGTVYDYFDGIQDLKQRKIQFVGDAEKRIQDNYLHILRYFRFYGRIALDENSHNTESLEIIRKNAFGLSWVAGERLWVELKKILSGCQNYHLLKLMIELGLAPFLGLPEEPDVGELDKLWARAADLQLHPMTILIALMKSDDELLEFHLRLKLSWYERGLGLFLLLHRGSTTIQEPLLHYQALVFEGKTAFIIEYVLELLKYQGESELLEQFMSWEIPKFPLNDHVLKARGIPTGRRFSPILNVLKQRWLQSKFTLTKEQLLDLLEDVQNEVNK